ncbi:hypothetical protein K504DRAFT_466489 [Pleomassaria siparia CBS 279.74]|uniref:Uncharacterized protein n=1 Tax=Pleomassaria siparia CBS 279.74 TaxID=1314801 RepID=A0A6G1KB75_9PLEO|nr:hypothetical protein K504DRAFT_466489 [Pleomassaria siparia CBS 279.74]
MEAPPEPEEVYREISPKTGRAIIYIFKFSNIRHPAGPIRKYIEIPSGSPEPPFIRVSLPSIYANRMWRRQNKLSKHKRELKDDIEKAAAEEEAALVLLHSSQDVYLSSDEEDGGTDIEETRDSNEVLRDPRTYDAELLSSKSVNSSIGDPLSGSDKEMDRRAVQKIMTASPQNENIFVQDEEAQPQVPVVLENQKGLVERQVLTNKQSSLETPIDHWNGETLLDDLSQPEESPFAFMLPVSDDPSAIQSTIAKHVLRIGGETARIYQHELVGFSHMFPGTKVLRDFFAYLPLHMDTLLGPEVDKSVEKQWYGIKTIYGDKIQQLSVSVRVAQMVQYARPKDMPKSNAAGLIL